MRIKVIWILFIVLIGASCILTGCRLKQSSTEDVCIPEGFYDGDSSGYDWALEELKLGKWVQFTDANEKQCSLSIIDDTMEYSDGNSEPVIFEYSIPEDTVKYGRPDIEEWVELYSGDDFTFNYVYFHEEQVGDTEYDVYPMISFVSVPENNDSVSVIEFVRDKDIDYFPKDFKTSVVRLYLVGEDSHFYKW